MGKKGRKFARLLCVMLAVIMCVAMLPMMTYAEETETGTNEIKDYVLLLDCSGTMNTYDPHELCAAACKQFMDQVPIENARVSIIAFGYEGGEHYQMDGLVNPELLKYVHLVTPLQETATVKNTKGIKEQIDDITEIFGNVSPLGVATLAAIDHLEKSGSTDGNAAIIVIADGAIATGNSTSSYDVDNVDIAIDRANSHDWKLFTIQMNNGGSFSDSSTESTRMRNMAEKTGVGSFGYVNVQDFSEGSLDINVAIARIITYMSGTGIVPDPITMELPAETTLNVADLASECNITLLGSSIQTVTLTYPDGTTRTITGNIDEARLVTSWEENSRNIKLIVPNPGDYNIKVEGENTGEKTAILFSYLVMDPTLVMFSDPVMESGTILSKDDSITFDAHFTYHGIDILNNKYYSEHPAELRIISSAGSTKTFQMTGTSDGYTFTLPMHDAGNGGAYTAQIWLPDSSFIGGGKYSDIIHFKTENLLPTITNPALPSLEGYIGQSFETIDLSNYLSNPDSDALDYRLNCVSDRNVTVEYTIENDYLNILCGSVPAEYEMELSFKDSEMTEYLVFNTFKLTVMERPLEGSSLPDAELWIDSYSFQDAGADSFQIDLKDYYSDPDGLTLNFSKAEDEGGFVDIEQDGSVLNITPALKGETVVTFTVDDTFNTLEGEINITVVSGKAVFWAENWIWFALALAAIVLIVLIILLISANTRVKGKWNVTIQSGFSTATIEGIDFHVNTKVGRKKTFLLKDLLNAIVPLMNGGAEISPVLPNFLVGTGVENIVMKGILGGRGCIMDNLPVNNLMTTVSYNGLENQKKLKVLMGEVVLNINTLSGDNLRITMTL